MQPPLTFTLSEVPTPLGAMLVATDDEGRLRLLDWKTHEDRMHRLVSRLYGPGRVRLLAGDASPAVVENLHAFFAGDLAALDGIVVETAGTPFQRDVWAALRQIPAGKTWTYGQLARHIGRPSAVRAVGAANGANPIGVVVPCHRVIGHDGALTGYAGGMDRKTWLLDHERRSARAA
jgi:methylated-DNA-[protein]-cysteine S-methyltransferase